MLKKIMRALGDGYRSFVAELEETWKSMNRAEASKAELEAVPVVHDCADDLEHLG